MNHSQQKVLRYLTGSENIDSIAVEDLQRLADENPYFPVVQFLLTKKLKYQADPAFLPQVQKTALYFSNPYWLHYQLEEPSSEFIAKDSFLYKAEGSGTAQTAPGVETKNSIEELHPVTTEFSINEINAASILAHDTLVEDSVKEIEDFNGSEQENTVAAENGDDDPHPITTEFSIDELEAASELAHETLKEPTEDKNDDPVWEVSSENGSIVNSKEQKKNLEETDIETLEKNTSDVEETKEVISQPEEEMAALTRNTDEKTDDFLEQLPESEPSVTRDIIEEVVLETLSPAGNKDAIEKTIETTENDSEEELSQPEEETDAITRGTDENTDEFLKQLEKEETIPRDNIEEVVLETLTPSEAIEKNVPDENETKEIDPDQTAQAALKQEEDIEMSSSTPSTEPLNPAVSATSSNSVDKDSEAEPDEHEKMFQNIKAMLDATSDEADADVENAVIPIDPYYTIDYFASQGIKLDLEQHPQDQLGQHLKKFTQWLKHMKKLGPEDATEAIRKETEADIVQIADSSNTVREVVTEAMAQVLEKQGKKDKAIELYTKLSFLNPHKSTYFAHKIKNLKGT